MPSFWTITKIGSCLALPVETTEPTRSIPSITTDSRAVEPGCLFVAIRGDTHDGHQFIPQAIEKGSIAILMEQSPSANLLALAQKKDVALFHVPSTLAAIRTLAHAYRKSFTIPFIAVVGAVGKTTTKELIASLFSGKFKSIHKTEGSQNGFLGIPLTLLALKPETEIAIIEIGIDEIGAMEQHLSLVEPTHTILTTIGPEHLHQLKTVEIAAEEELKALDYSLAHSAPMAINLSDSFVATWFQKHRTQITPHRALTYSLHSNKNPDFSGKVEDSSLAITSPKWKLNLHLPLPGEHHAHNLLAAVTLCSFFEMTPEEIQVGLASFKTAYGRTEIYTLSNGVSAIGDYYNSNPTSATAAIQLLAELHHKKNSTSKMHAALGDMLELGEGEEAFHRALAPILLQHQIDHIWLYGPRMKWLLDELEKQNSPKFKVAHFNTHEDLYASLKNSIQPGDSILIKGSRGMKMEQILKSLLADFKPRAEGVSI